MNRILSIPAADLHPGDRIVRAPILPAIEVVEPGVMPSLPGLVRVCVRENGRLTTLHASTHSRYDIDRPNLVIPGLEG